MLAALRGIYEDDVDALEARVSAEIARKHPSPYQKTRLKLLRALSEEFKTKKGNKDGEKRETK